MQTLRLDLAIQIDPKARQLRVSCLLFRIYAFDHISLLYLHFNSLMRATLISISTRESLEI
jgi:hypothetical protein